MSPTRWILVCAAMVVAVHGAPRELSSDELITEPRPGEEYVNIQTGPPASQDKLDLQEKSFTTSHRIPQYSKNKKSEPFQTSHKIPNFSVKTSKSIKAKAKPEVRPSEPHYDDSFDTAESNPQPAYEEVKPNTVNATDAAVEVVTKTSVKMSKSKKVQKSVLKLEDVKLDIKANKGVIDETDKADPEELEVMVKKISKNEKGIFKTDEERLKVPFEPEETATTTTADEITNTPNNPEATTIPWTVTTTDEPPITTFNYKNPQDKSKKTNEAVQIVPENKEIIDQNKFKYETVSDESLKTAETRSQTGKKGTKQEKKDKFKKADEIHRKEDIVGFDVVSLSKSPRKLREENFDFVDADEKVLLPAASSPSQSSRISIKKGPNGQDYEYEYVYYYYDEDEDGANGTANPKEGKVVASTTEQVYNGHDGPSVEHQDDVPSSTSGNKYLPTEATKTQQNARGQPQREEVEEDEEEEEILPTRSRDNTNRYTSISRPIESVNNEVLPATSRPAPRTRGRVTNIPGAQPVSAEEIPSVGDERLPSNTRFPPRSRSNNVATSPQPQETTSRTRSRENNSQSRVRLPNLGLLDSSSFRTHASDASIDEDPVYDTELQRRPVSRTQTTEGTVDSHPPRIRSRPTTVSTTVTTRRTTESSEEDIPRRPVSRRPVEERPLPKPETEVEFDRSRGNIRRPETTRESDSEEGNFDVTKIPYTTVRKQPSTVVRPFETTTEDLSAIGLTSAMMEKVALDLYAILQQAHNENIKTNFVDGNATDATIETDDSVTEISTTASTTTEAPTTTTTTTTTTTPVTERGRYRIRGGSSASKTRTRISTTTTESSNEASSPRTRGRTQSSYSSRHSPTSLRRGLKPKTSETQEEPAVQEEVTKQSAEKSFGERPSRNRYRIGAKPSVSSTTTGAPQISGAAAVVGSRSSSLDRYNARRRTSRRFTTSTTLQPEAGEASQEENKDEVQQELSHSTEETHSTASTKPLRGRVNIASPRPLRPGPRINLNLSQRGRATTSTTQVPTESDEVEKEAVSEEEQHAPQVVEEVQETSTTAAPDALTRLRNRPRLRIGSNSVQHKPQTTAAPPANRKKLVSSLLPKRNKPVEEKATEKVDDLEKIQEEPVSEEEISSSVEPSSTTAEPETKGLSGLLAGRRRNLNRRPGTIYSRNQAETS